LALNVYEYHEGVVSLISDGKDRTESGKLPALSPELLGTDASGEDVFFATNSQLTAKDTDTQRDYYDARVGGGEEAQVVVPPCESDACRGAGSVPPPFGPLTSTLTGPSGNLTPASTPPPGTGPKAKPPSKQQLLEKAVKSCRTKYKAKKKKQRAACERSARKRFAAKPKPKAKRKAKKSSKGARR
jgi:hypothetical protein